VQAVKAINNGQTIVDLYCPSGQAVREVYVKTIDYLNRGKIYNLKEQSK